MHLYVELTMVEFGEAYFSVSISEIVKEKGFRGKRAAGKQYVAMMAGSISLEDIVTEKTSKHCRYFKAVALDSYKSNDINDTISLDEECIVFTDKIKSYADIADFVELHVMEKLYLIKCSYNSYRKK